MTTAMTIGFVPIARPTFDVPLAEEMTQQVRAQLVEAGYSLHEPDGLIMNTEALDSWIESAREADLDLLLVLQSSFADSTMAIALAEAISAPMLMWALPEPRVGGRLRLNSFCGINLAAHGLKRRNYPYDTVYAAPDDAKALEKVGIIAAAGHVKRRLAETRIGRIGENPAGFDTCLVNYDGLDNQLGVEIVQVELNTVFDGVRQADAERVAAVAETVKARIAGFDEMESEPANGTLGTFITLDDMAQRDQLDGLAVRCWPEFFTDLGCSACGAMSMMSDKMTPTSCEADVNGTITQLMLQWISGEPAFGSDLVAFDGEKDEAVLWHCGLAPLSMADPDVQPEAALHSNRQKPLLMQFPLKPGRVTMARLSEASGEFRLVIATGEMLKSPPSFTGTSGTVRFDNGAQQVMETLLEEGLEHHISLTYGDYAETLVAVAKYLGMPVLRL